MPPENNTSMSEFFQEIGRSLNEINSKLNSLFIQAEKDFAQIVSKMAGQERLTGNQEKIAKEAGKLVSGMQVLLTIATNVVSFSESRLNAYQQDQEQLSLQSKGNKNDSSKPIALQPRQELEKNLNTIAEQLNNIALTVKSVFEQIKNKVEQFFNPESERTKHQSEENTPLSMRPQPTAYQDTSKNSHQQHAKDNQYVEFMKESLKTLMNKTFDGVNNALTHAMELTHQMQDNLAKSNNPDKNQAEQNIISQAQQSINLERSVVLAETIEKQAAREDSLNMRPEPKPLPDISLAEDDKSAIAPPRPDGPQIIHDERREKEIIDAENLIDDEQIQLQNEINDNIIKSEDQQADKANSIDLTESALNTLTPSNTEAKPESAMSVMTETVKLENIKESLNNCSLPVESKAAPTNSESKTTETVEEIAGALTKV